MQTIAVITTIEGVEGEQLVCTSSKSPFTEAMKDITAKILAEHDMSFSEFAHITITVEFTSRN